MRAVSFKIIGFLCATAPFLAGCIDGTGAGRESGFKAQYTAARSALEDGKYDRANRLYPQLMKQAGPLTPRIRLEYAHSLLRAGDHAAAAQQAGILANSQTGQARAAALSVQGTALHELGIAALQNGNAPAAKTHLTQAEAAMAEVLKSHPDLDPLGALAGRLASLRVRLKAIG